MRRVLLIGAGIAILLLVLSQLLLPLYLEGRAEDRLTSNGGKADVTLKAFPALTLLEGSGREAKVSGTGLNPDLNGGGDKPLDDLDGFGKVDIGLRASTAGPLHNGALTIRRGRPRDPPVN